MPNGRRRKNDDDEEDEDGDDGAVDGGAAAGDDSLSLAEKEQTLERLQRQLVEMKLPLSPLDDLISKLGGHAKVAEMTGRKQVPKAGTFARGINPRYTKKRENAVEREDFQGDRKQVRP